MDTKHKNISFRYQIIAPAWHRTFILSKKENNMKPWIIGSSIALVYLLMAILTYGYAVAREDHPSHTATVCGCAWPFYWVFFGISELGDISVSLFTETQEHIEH